MAKNAPIEDSLLELITCSVCYEEIEKLKVLPCQHTTCLPCLKQLSAKQNRIRCPVCNREHTVPNGGCDHLPDCLMAKQIADLIKAKKETVGSESDSAATAKPANDSELNAISNLPSKVDAERSVSSEPAQEVKDGGEEACEIEGTEAQDPDMAIRDKRSNDVKGMALCKELERAVEEGQQRYTTAQQLISNFKAIKAKIATDAQITKEAIETHRQHVELKSKEKTLDVDNSEAAQTAEVDKSIGSVEPNADKIKASIDSAPGLIARLANGSCKPEDITSAQQLLDEIRGLETNLDLPSVEQDVKAEDLQFGDSVRFNYAKDSPVDEILNGVVSMNSVGLYIGMQVGISHLTGKQAHQPFVIFPEKYDWKGKSMESIKKSYSKSALVAPGDRVRIKSSVKQPYISWKGVRAGESRGLFTGVKSGEKVPEGDVMVTIDFPEERGWKGLYSEIERVPGCGFEVGDEVRIRSDITEPRRGWAGVARKSIGKIAKIEGSVGREEITVNFPECNSWVGLPSELEIPRRLKKGDKVKVKSTVTTPEQGWRGISHKDIGTLKNVPENSVSDQTAQVKFPRKNELWSCKLDELEIANETPAELGMQIQLDEGGIRAALQPGMQIGLGGGLAGALLGQPGLGMLGMDDERMRELARRFGAM